MSDKILYAWVPGLPHLLCPNLNPSYHQLANACRDVGLEFRRQGVKRILYYSTQWLSVLGQSVQMRSRLTGRHVDENWYEIANLDFDFRLDLPLSSKLIDRSREVGLQVRAVDYEGFPVDTGTIVADRLINADGLPTAMYSCCVYSDYTETMTIGKVAADAVASVDGVTAIVVVSGLSGRYFTTEIDFSEDHVRDPGDDAWNKRILDWLAKGEWDRIRQVRDEYCRAAKVDMGLKALAFLEGAGVNHPRRHVETLAYGPIYGTGAAVMLGQRR